MSEYLRKLEETMAERNAEFDQRLASVRSNPVTNLSDPNAATTPPPVRAQQLRKELDIVSRDSIYTDMSSVVTNVFRGINVLGYQAPVPINKDQYGYTFFTKPRMNLEEENLIQFRKLAQLASEDSTTMGNAIRAYLDPVGHNTSSGGFESAIVDKKNIFIPLLTNTLESLSGWPDPLIDTYKAAPGVRKETWMMYDGVVEINNDFPLTATFRNITRDPISFLFDTWLLYGSGVREGMLRPRRSAVVFKELDYQTRIWRIVLDETRTHVTKIAACFAAQPVNISLGKAFDYNSAAPYNQNNSSINVQFDAVGATYNDPILFQEFNESVGIYNKQMVDDDARYRFYKRLSPQEVPLFNYRAYPRIDPDTLRFEWYVDYTTYFGTFPDEAGEV